MEKALPIPRYIDSNGIPMQSTALENATRRLLLLSAKVEKHIAKLGRGPKSEDYRRDLAAIDLARRALEAQHAFLHAAIPAEQRDAMRSIVAQAYEPDFDALSEQVLEEQKAPARPARLVKENGNLAFQPALEV